MRSQGGCACSQCHSTAHPDHGQQHTVMINFSGQKIRNSATKIFDLIVRLRYFLEYLWNS